MYHVFYKLYNIDATASSGLYYSSGPGIATDLFKLLNELTTKNKAIAIAATAASVYSKPEAPHRLSAQPSINVIK